MTEPVRVALPDWIRALAASHPFGAGDRRGTANLIDAAARARAAACVRTGDSVSLARPLLGGDYNTTADRPGFRHETWYRPDADGTGWGQDHLVLNPHGLQNTHLDALNHVAVDGTFYGGRPVADTGQGSADVLAPDGLVTRAIYVDIPHHRGTDWADRPVDGADIDAALAGPGWSWSGATRSASTWGETGSKRPRATCSAARRPNRTRAGGCPPTAPAGSRSTRSRSWPGTCSTPGTPRRPTPPRTS